MLATTWFWLDSGHSGAYFESVSTKMASHIPFQFMISAERRMCNLYKRAVRLMENWEIQRIPCLYHATLIRARFDEIEKCRDNNPDLFNQLMKEEEEKLHYLEFVIPKKRPKSIGGIAYGREPYVPDWVLDYWHPLEKAQYPKYFATREKRKEEFIKMWEEKYGKPDACKSDHH